MEFWGIKVKPGATVNIKPDDDKFLHLSQASLGELKGKENVVIYVKVDDQKLVLGTLSSKKCPQIPFDLVFEKEFQLSHTSKNTIVYFAGYKAPVGQEEESDPEDYPVSESESEKVPVGQNANVGKAVAKQDQGQPGAGKANAVKEDKSAAKKAKKAEPVKVDKPKAEDNDDKDDDDDVDDDDDSEESEDDEDLVGAMSDSDDEDEDESSEEEDEATPKMAMAGKRPATDSASKTPSEKKAKVVTPAGQKTGGDGKNHVHVATPHPAKQTGKTPGNSDKSKQQTPKSVGSVVCKSCSRTFNSDNALQAHTKAKHG